MNMESTLVTRVKHPGTGESFVLPRICCQDGFEFALNYRPDPTGVIVCSFPKSGSTWLQNIIWLILRKGKPIPAENSIHDIFPFLERGEIYSSFTSKGEKFPNTVKTHLPLKFVPLYSDAKYIQVSREPKDVCVSFYHHFCGFKAFNCQHLEFSTFFDWFVEGKLPYGKYKPYIDEWNQAKDLKNILFLKYEDMKQNPKGNILRVAKFLGPEHETRMLQNDEEILKKVLHHSSLDEMKRTEGSWCPNPRFEGNPFIRKGVVGDWKNYMTEEQAKTIDGWF